MPYSILVVNQQPLGKINAEKLILEMKAVNFVTLCDQYGLDPQLITGARAHLDVILTEENVSPYFAVMYNQSEGRPIIVQRWNAKSKAGIAILNDFINQEIPDVVVEHLRNASSILRIELHESQLQDLGLILAYEIARWAAFKGRGMILGLDGIWYRLNHHRAFIPGDLPTC